jgi:hypothetical protein
MKLEYAVLIYPIKIIYKTQVVTYGWPRDYCFVINFPVLCCADVKVWYCNQRLFHVICTYVDILLKFATSNSVVSYKKNKKTI